MDANLDTLCTFVYCTADDLLPAAKRNARRRVSDAEIVTLCVAQSIMGIPSDRRFLASARTRLGHLFMVTSPSVLTPRSAAALTAVQVGGEPSVTSFRMCILPGDGGQAR